MADKMDWPPPATLLAFAVLVGVCAVALYFVLPVFGTACGLAIAVAGSGLASAGLVGAWVAPVASAGVAVIAVSAAVAVIRVVSKSVQAKPYEWGLPLLAAFAGFATTLAKAVGFNEPITRWIFGGMTMLLIVVAGACYTRPSKLFKAMAVVLYLVPPVTVLALSATAPHHVTPTGSISDISGWTWVGLGLMLIIGLLIVFLVRLDEAKKNVRRLT